MLAGEKNAFVMFQDSVAVPQTTDTIRQDTTSQHDTATSHPSIQELGKLEKLFQQAEQRLRADSIKKQSRKRKVVPSPAVRPEQTGQDPYDSIQFAGFTAAPPDNTPVTLLKRSFSWEGFQEADSSREYREKGTKEKHFTTTLRPVQGVAVERRPAYLRENWMFGLLVFVFLVISWGKLRFGKVVNQTLTALWDPKNANILFRNRSALYQTASSLLLLSAFITITLFLYLFLKAFFPGVVSVLSPLRVYASIFGVVGGVYLYFQLMLRVVAYLSLSGEMLGEYRHFTKLYFIVTGLYLFPLTAVIPYLYQGIAERLLLAGAGLVVFFYLFRIVKLISLFLRERFSFFFMILYLCALEILPVALLLKYLFR